MSQWTKRTGRGLCLLLLIQAIGAGKGQTPSKRDHLTEKEVALVREYQELDLRVEVFLRARGARGAIAVR